MNMESLAKQSYQQKGVPKCRLLCHFAFNPRVPPPCAVRCPGDVLYFARMVSVSRISLRSVSSRFCWILKTLHSCTKFLIHGDIEVKQSNHTVDIEERDILIAFVLVIVSG